MKRDGKAFSWMPGSGKTKRFYKRLARRQERRNGNRREVR